MKLNLIEKLMTNSPVRALVQKKIEGPRLRSMALKKNYPLCLELGAGTGRGTEIILNSFGAEKVVATDIDPAQLEKAGKRLGRYGEAVSLKIEDAMGLDQPDNIYDAVFAFGVIHHTEDWRKAMREIERVLKPGGEYFFDELLKNFLKSPFAMMTRHPEGGMFTYDEFIGYLKEAGLYPARQWRWNNIWLLGTAVKNKKGVF
ncbi:MAG: class I SAM-dependent methyltransferase [Nitrospiraceae bacterium]|nr:class I SAM-dependent methyltransferase [Nitrospiraceae bacterium]